MTDYETELKSSLRGGLVRVIQLRIVQDFVVKCPAYSDAGRDIVANRAGLSVRPGQRDYEWRVRLALVRIDINHALILFIRARLAQELLKLPTAFLTHFATSPDALVKPKSATPPTPPRALICLARASAHSVSADFFQADGLLVVKRVLACNDLAGAGGKYE